MSTDSSLPPAETDPVAALASGTAPSNLIDIITSSMDEVRDQALDAWCRQRSLAELQQACIELDRFRRECDNLYQRVRALFFLYSIHRFHMPERLAGREVGIIPFSGFESLLQRRFHEAIDDFLAEQAASGPSVTLCSALASAYHRLAFQTLADQVRRSVRTVRGNQWMFRTGHPQDLPLRIRKELLSPTADGGYPILAERTSVRMDFSHSGWSDIFFLGMDFPKVLALSTRVLTWRCKADMKRRSRLSNPPFALSMNPCCAWSAWTWMPARKSNAWSMCTTSVRIIWDCSKPP